MNMKMTQNQTTKEKNKTLANYRSCSVHTVKWTTVVPWGQVLLPPLCYGWIGISRGETAYHILREKREEAGKMKGQAEQLSATFNCFQDRSEKNLTRQAYSSSWKVKLKYWAQIIFSEFLSFSVHGGVFKMMIEMDQRSGPGRSNPSQSEER